MTPLPPPNPFSSRFVRPGAQPYLFPEGLGAADLVRALAVHGWRGAIVGPHGTGKSTLVAALVPLLRDAGRTVAAAWLHRGDRLPVPFWEALGRGPRGALVAVVDGYEQLGPWARWRLRRRCRRRGHGLLVTSHGPTALPTLWQTHVTPALAWQVVARMLPPDHQDRFSPAEVADLLAAHGGNLREALFALYDRFRNQAAPRTAGL